MIVQRITANSALFQHFTTHKLSDIIIKYATSLLTSTDLYVRFLSVHIHR